MITMRVSGSAETNFWLSERKKAQLNRTYQPLSLSEGIAIYVRRASRKIYGTSKYKPNGERYTKAERPWLF